VTEHFRLNGIPFKELNSNEECIAALATGQADCAVCPKYTWLYLKSQRSYPNIAMLATEIYPSRRGIAVHKGDAQLLAQLNEGIFQLKENGTLDRLYADHFGALEASEVPLAKLIQRGIRAGLPILAIAILAALALWSWALRRMVRTGTAQFQEEFLRRTRMEEAFQQSRANLEALVESTSDLIWSVDRDLRLLTFNSAFEGQLRTRYGTEARVGATTAELLPAERVPWWLRAYDRAFTLGAFSQELELANGQILSLALHPIVRDQKTVGISVFGKDITDSRRAEAESLRLQFMLQQAQKMESLGNLAGGIAHDMNNVLGAILGLASTHAENLAEGDRARRAFETIARAAVRGGKMVRSLLSFARQSPADEQELNLNELLTDEVQLLERTTLAKVRLVQDLALDLKPIRGDASALAHVFMNLCVNAVDAMDDDGTLTLRTRVLEGDWIEVVVADTGCGMKREVLERALDPFFTTKEVGKGTGLGLSLAYRTVIAHQGQMDIQSEPGRGTTVRMRFPVSVAGLAAAEPQAEGPATAAGAALRVLLVDDDDLIQHSTQEMLKLLGHEVHGVLSGEESLVTLQAGYPAEVVILDMNMPGLGGAGTLPRLRLEWPRLPILLATGRADQAAIDLVEQHPGVGLLSKPFTSKELKRCLEALMARG
jgi:signal transduction histidine kinase